MITFGLMLKKKIALFSIVFAYAILLLHNTTPHHHHDKDHELTGHHETDQHHKHDSGSDALKHIFCYVAHPADLFSFATAHNITNTFTKQPHSFVAILPDPFSLDEHQILPLLYKSQAEHFVKFSRHTLLSALRAPPVTFI
jgi:mRNA-degrading endonuclease YafQ of YafQ-DinJ toxin-antitoxin module